VRSIRVFYGQYLVDKEVVVVFVRFRAASFRQTTILKLFGSWTTTLTQSYLLLICKHNDSANVFQDFINLLLIVLRYKVLFLKSRSY
jgi:hypothetical protein